MRLYIPKGWVGPIHEFDFVPLVSDEDFKLIMAGGYPNDSTYDKWYIKAAVEDWKEKNEEKQNTRN